MKQLNNIFGAEKGPCFYRETYWIRGMFYRERGFQVFADYDEWEEVLVLNLSEILQKIYIDNER